MPSKQPSMLLRSFLALRSFLDTLKPRKRTGLEPDVYPIDTLFNPSLIPNQAIAVVKKLQAQRFDAYIVGGAVRDLLSGKAPKDFDIVTSARPEKIRKLFKNALIIGKRFPIVHVRLGGMLFEVSTLRNHQAHSLHAGKVQNKDGYITRHRAFSTHMDDDVTGRDLTINALYFDPIKKVIYDFFDGIQDAQDGRIVVIGEASKRFTEDPVRMIRILRHAAQLDLEISPMLRQEIKHHLHLLENINEHRLLEEFKKLFMNGDAMKVMQILRDFQALGYLFGKLAPKLEEEGASKLLDQVLLSTQTRLKSGNHAHPSFVLCAFLWADFNKPQNPKKLPNKQSVLDVVRSIHARTHLALVMPMLERVASIWWLQMHIESLSPTSDAAQRLGTHPSFRAAYDFLELRSRAGDADVPQELVDAWRELYEKALSRRQQTQANTPRSTARQGKRGGKGRAHARKSHEATLEKADKKSTEKSTNKPKRRRRRPQARSTNPHSMDESSS